MLVLSQGFGVGVVNYRQVKVIRALFDLIPQVTEMH